VKIKPLESFKKWQMSVMTKGRRLLYDTVFNVRYHVVCFSYLVMYYGGKVLGYLGGVCPFHIVVTQYTV
jgi:hypothetical protein